MLPLDIMVRRRWPDIVIIVGIVGLVLGGIWVLWGSAIQDRLDGGHQDSPPVVSGGGVT